MHATAFPSMGFVARALRDYELALIPAALPAHDMAVWADHLTPDVAVALITHVHSNTGVRSPVGDIVKLCRERDVHTVVDVAQSAGIIPVNVHDWCADLVLGSCVKWLCGGPGAGYMWVNPRRLEDLFPEDVGWFSHENPFEFDIEQFRYSPTARRFWGGTPSVAPYALALGGIRTINGIGVESIRVHNLELMHILKPDMDAALTGGTLCLPVGSDQAKALQQANVHFDQRGDIARLSFHIYNSAEQADRVAKLLGK